MLKRVLAELMGGAQRRTRGVVNEQDALLHRGREALAGGRANDALAAARSILSDDSTHSGALDLAYAACAALGDYASGIPLLRTSAERGSATAHRLLGMAYRKSGDLEAAAASLERAVSLQPEDHRGWNELGVFELVRGRTRAARVSLERALVLAPDSAEAHCNLGIVALDELDFGEAVRRLRRAIELDPALIEARCTLGLALYAAGDMQESERVIVATLEQSPDNALARSYSAFFLLGRGEWREGWRRFEARLVASDPPFAFRWPRWNGEPVAGKRLLICGEQGLGDQIMFASCVPDLIARRALCTLVVDRRLNDLMKRAFPEADVIEDESVREVRDGDFDYQVAMGSLPRFFRNELAHFPSRQAYLAADAGRVSAWKRRLGALGPGLKVGLSWRGGTLSTRRALRSINLDDLVLPLSAAGVRFVNLQYGDCADELGVVRRMHGIAVDHWPEAIGDYDETAALVCALDLVISVCTSVVHLSGGLGQRTWVLAPASPEWRYGFAGETMPWYPSVRVYRQPANRDWTPAIADVAAGLTALLKVAAAPGSGMGRQP